MKSIRKSIKFGKILHFKKKHIIPVCCIKNLEDQEKENLIFQKPLSLQQKNNVISKPLKRKFGTNLTNLINNSKKLPLPRNNFSKLLDLSLKPCNSTSHIIHKSSSRKSIKQTVQHEEKNHQHKYSFGLLKNTSKGKNNFSKNNKDKKDYNKYKSPRNSLTLTQFQEIKKKFSFNGKIRHKSKDAVNRNSNINNPILHSNSQNKLEPLKSQHIKKSSQSNIRISFIPHQHNTKQHNPQFAMEYLNYIYDNLLKEEKDFIIKSGVNANYMKNQKEINEEMRAILINWIIEVHDKFSYKEQTLFICVDLIDRYLSCHTIEKSQYQLVGIAALYIASKHEEVELPNPREFVYITENAYRYDELYQMEYNILKDINFEVMVPTILDFYQCISKKFYFNNKEDSLGRYFINASLLCYEMLNYTHSTIASAAAYLSYKFCRKNSNEEIVNISRYNKSTLPIKNAIKDITQLMSNVDISDKISIKSKFNQEKYNKIASFFSLSFI